MGSIEQLASGNYRAYAWNAAAQEKEPVKPTAGRSFKTWAEADAAVQRRERELDGVYEEAGVPVRRQRPKVGFTEYAWRWDQEAGGELNTRLTRATKIRMMLPTFGKYDDINDIELRHVRAWWAEQERRYAPTTRVCTLSALNKLMKAAVHDDVRDDNPVELLQAEVGSLTQRVQEVRYITDEELLLTLYYLPAWMWPAALIAHDCGLRAAEVAGLRWMRIDLDKRTVLVKDVMEVDRTLRPWPKGKKAVELPLTKRAAEALRVLKEATGGQSEDFVFRSSWGKPTTGNYLNSLWSRARKAAGFSDSERVTFHMLRHATGNNLALNGAQAPVIQAVLRHAQLSTSQTYIDDIKLDAARAWMDKVAADDTATVTQLKRRPRGKRAKRTLREAS